MRWRERCPLPTWETKLSALPGSYYGVDFKQQGHLGAFAGGYLVLGIANSLILPPIHNKCRGFSTKLVQVCTKSQTLIMDRTE